MPWAQFDDHFHDSEGALIAGTEACGLHLWATCWCAAHLSDGRLPAGILKRFLASCQDEHGAELVARLIEAQLWEPIEDGDYLLRDFLSGNRSRAQVEEDREKKKQAGRKGGRTNAKRNREARSQEPEQAEEYEDDPLGHW